MLLRNKFLWVTIALFLFFQGCGSLNPFPYWQHRYSAIHIGVNSFFLIRHDLEFQPSGDSYRISYDKWRLEEYDFYGVLRKRVSIDSLEPTVDMVTDLSTIYGAQILGSNDSAVYVALKRTDRVYEARLHKDTSYVLPQLSYPLMAKYDRMTHRIGYFDRTSRTWKSREPYNTSAISGAQIFDALYSGNGEWNLTHERMIYNRSDSLFYLLDSLNHIIDSISYDKEVLGFSQSNSRYVSISSYYDWGYIKKYAVTDENELQLADVDTFSSDITFFEEHPYGDYLLYRDGYKDAEVRLLNRKEKSILLITEDNLHIDTYQ